MLPLRDDYCAIGLIDAADCDVPCVSHRAAYDGDLQQLEALMEAGVLSLDHRDQFGSTLLHKGIKNNTRNSG